MDDARETMWCRRMRDRHPDEAAQWPAETLQSTVRSALQICPSLEIEEERDIARFIALAMVLTDAQKQSPLVQGVMQRVLAHFDWDATKRLDFLHTHLVGRPVSPDEMDFGPTFVPTAPEADDQFEDDELDD
ncbi:MAG: hypothetical protein K0V04_04440 [Deltaproteobacteria bacterium]|nr:hypothetical protein [Deltaproteobacteria bacterium]